MTTAALVLQTTYDHLEIGLTFSGVLIDYCLIDKREASALIIVRVEELLQKHTISLQTISYLAVNQGPAPYTSIRVVIATANGIQFASQIPLIGIDGLVNFMEEYGNNQQDVTVALFNAFNREVFFALKTSENELRTGCTTIEALFPEIIKIAKEKRITFIGSGVLLYQNEIQQALGEHAYVADPLPLYNSLSFIGNQAFEKWKKQGTVQQVFPLYLKTISYKTSVVS